MLGHFSFVHLEFFTFILIAGDVIFNMQPVTVAVSKPTSSSPRHMSKRDVRAPLLRRLYGGITLGSLRVFCLLGLDALLLAVSWQIGEFFGTPSLSLWRNVHRNPADFLAIAIGISAIVAGGFHKSGDSRRNYLGLVKAVTTAALLLLVIDYIYQPKELISRSQFLLFWISSILFILTNHFLIDRLVFRLRSRGAICYPTYLIADSSDLEHATRLIDQENRYAIVGIRSSDSLDSAERENTLAEICQLGVSEVFISWDAIKERQFLCWQFQSIGVIVHVVPVGLDALFHRSKFWSMGSFPVFSFSAPSITAVDFWIKRGADFGAALCLLIVLAPIYFVLGLLIKLDSPGPIFYGQTRVGLQGRSFKAWKFRTMVTNAEQLQGILESKNEMKDGILFKLKEDPRVTRVGQVLRRYSLDELPQLFNVLLGEMSLVGPRPLPIRDVEKFEVHHYVRHAVLPGITGLWQVSGRSNISNFEEVIQLDLDYIHNWSLGLDLKILLKTIKVVFNKTGAY
jgi:exopolysaccharide biosynthesis polyprenyl glycosylphosphotransferase